MSPKLGLVLSFLLASTAPVWAQSACGSVPFAPAMPSQADMRSKSIPDAETALHDAFTDIKNWQGDLKTYRSCLDGQTQQAKAGMAGLDKDKDADKIAAFKDQAATSNKLFDSSVDQEEKVVNEFHGAQAAYCMRSDANKAKCPK
ncbi:MAG TPA: hypothetical protein VGG48_01300 [Rhizomicrobium sp.]|jgi:hypothetical protein